MPTVTRLPLRKISPACGTPSNDVMVASSSVMTTVATSNAKTIHGPTAEPNIGTEEEGAVAVAHTRNNIEPQVGVKRKNAVIHMKQEGDETSDESPSKKKAKIEASSTRTITLTQQELKRMRQEHEELTRAVKRVVQLVRNLQFYVLNNIFL